MLHPHPFVPAWAEAFIYTARSRDLLACLSTLKLYALSYQPATWAHNLAHCTLPRPPH